MLQSGSKLPNESREEENKVLQLREMFETRGVTAVTEYDVYETMLRTTGWSFRRRFMCTH
jgi:hypothetical protein